jgi:hypothetical protein
LIYEISLEDLLREVGSPLLRGNGASEGGNNLSFHVTVPLVGTELGVDTFVPEVRVSTPLPQRVSIFYDFFTLKFSPVKFVQNKCVHDFFHITSLKFVTPNLKYR